MDGSSKQSSEEGNGHILMHSCYLCMLLLVRFGCSNTIKLKLMLCMFINVSVDGVVPFKGDGQVYCVKLEMIP